MLREELERVRGMAARRGGPLGWSILHLAWQLQSSALIKYMEGHRGEAPNKPPFRAWGGAVGEPTLRSRTL